MKYDITIFDDGSKLQQIQHYLKSCKVKFNSDRIENNCGIRGVEFLGYEIKLTVDDERIIDTLSKIWLDAYVTAHKVNLKKFYKLRWFRRKAQPFKPNVIDIPF